MKKSFLGKVWYFIWEDDSLLSWLVNIVLAFVLIKFIVYPGLGFLLGTTHPVVAVVSGSMEHSLTAGRVCGEYPSQYIGNLDGWWGLCGDFYDPFSISKEDFIYYPFKNGFNKGDIIVLTGAEPEDINKGDVIVFMGRKPDPIIHRVIKKWQEDDGYHFTTKGDHNPGLVTDDVNIPENAVIGRALFRIPWLGYIKIWFVDILNFVGLPQLVRVFSAK